MARCCPPPGWGWAVGAPRSPVGAAVLERVRAGVGRGHLEVLPLAPWHPPCPCMVGPAGWLPRSPRNLGFSCLLRIPLCLSPACFQLSHTASDFSVLTRQLWGPLGDPLPAGTLSLSSPNRMPGQEGQGWQSPVRGGGEAGLGPSLHVREGGRSGARGPEAWLFPRTLAPDPSRSP